MDLKIKCDAKVDLLGFVNLIDVSCEISQYELKDNTLRGDVCVKGNYIKDDVQTEYAFEENVPFTVVFKEKNYEIKNIEIEDLQTSEIINHGIECKFDIYLVYDYKNNDNVELDVKDDNISSSKENNETVIEDDEAMIENDVDQKIKEDILKKYDEILSELLSVRNDVETIEEVIDEVDDIIAEDIQAVTDEDEKTNTNVRIIESDEKLKSWSDMIPESFTNYRVYYPQKESELDSICQKENISLDKIYNDNANKDFVNKKRIIIK